MSYFTINYFHSIVAHQNPCPTSFPYNVIEGIKRILGYSATTKSPVTVSQLDEMYNYFGSKRISSPNLQTIFLSILIEKSKTDVYRQGNQVYLTKIDTARCPIELISLYFKKGNIKDNWQRYIFRSIITTNRHSKLRNCDKHISYTCASENLIKGLKNI